MPAAIITLVLLVGYFIYKALENEREDNAHKTSMREEYEKELQAFHDRNVRLESTIDRKNAAIEEYQKQIRDLEREISRLEKIEAREREREESSEEIAAFNEGYEEGYQSGLGEPEKEAYKIGFMHGHAHGMEDERNGKDSPGYYEVMELAEQSMKTNNLNYE